MSKYVNIFFIFDDWTVVMYRSATKDVTEIYMKRMSIRKREILRNIYRPVSVQ